jgi:integrase
MRIDQRGKSNSIKDLLVKIARREHLEIFEGDSTPLSVYASAWLERKKATLARSTYGDYRSIWKKYVLPHFGNIPLCRVTRRDVEAFLDNLPEISAKRKNNIMVPLKCLFNDASRRGEIDEPPSENIRRLKEIKPFIDPFSFSEMKLLLEHVDPHYGAYFTTAFLTGMRPNEMIALKWSQVDFEMRCITVREGRVLGIEGPPKTMSSYRDIDMLDPLFEALRKHQEGARPGSTYVFPGKTGRPVEVNNLRKRVWYPAIAAAGLRRRTMYQTRHTFASLMLGHGEDPLWVARMLGHAGLDMIFKHYGKFIRNRSRKDGGRFLEGLKEAEAFLQSGRRTT